MYSYTERISSSGSGCALVSARLRHLTSSITGMNSILTVKIVNVCPKTTHRCLKIRCCHIPIYMYVNSIKVFLQRCALRSQDFAIFHREYIGFENPYQSVCSSSGFYIRIGTDSIRTQKSVRNLIVTKTRTSEQK